MSRPIVIDLFAGAGGLSLGFEQAGFDVVAAVEIDPVHSAVHKFNFPNCAVLPRSVIGLSGSELRHKAGIGSRHVDVMVGGAPCQGFSLIGQRAMDDPRNSLVKEYVRLVEEIQPSYFVFENVKGLTVGRHKAFLDEIVRAFADIGYDVRHPWRVLNVADFGVPQQRERLILLGGRKGLTLPEYPTAICRPAGGKGDKALALGPTCRDALGDLPDAEQFDALLHSDEVPTAEWGSPSPYAREMRCLGNDAWHFGYVRKWDPKILTSSLRTDHTEISRRRYAATPEGQVEPISRFFKLPSTGLSNTLRAGTDAARGAFTSPRPVHYGFNRCITVREMARLHGFPDWFRFHETKWHGAREIGNSVPPPFARAIARQVIAALGKEPTRPKQVIELGDVELLRLDMTGAALHFGVVVPIPKRNAKSGAKKRKQEEIEAMLFAGKEAAIG